MAGRRHVDTFDPKPALAKYDGQSPPGERARKEGRRLHAVAVQVCGARRERRRDERALPAPARCADDLCVIRSMHTDVPNHEPGLLLMHSGQSAAYPPLVSELVGCSFGLGTDNKNLPALSFFVPGDRSSGLSFGRAQLPAWRASRHRGGYKRYGGRASLLPDHS